MTYRLSFISSTILTALALSVSALSAGEFSGQVRLYGQFNQSVSDATSTPTTTPNQFELIRSRLRYDSMPNIKKGGVRRWGVTIEFDIPESDSLQLFKDAATALSENNTLQLSQANVVYLLNRNEIRFGLIDCPDLTTTFSDYSLAIGTPVGTLLQRSGYHVGALMRFQEQKYGGEIALWQQETYSGNPYQAFASFTPVSETITPSAINGAVSPETNLNGTEIAQSLPSGSFGDNAIPIAGAGRFSYVPLYGKNQSWGFSIGASSTPLKYPLIVGVLYQPYVAGVPATDSTDAVPAQGFYRMLAFQRVSGIAIDCLRTYRNVRSTVSFETQRMPIKTSASVLTNDTSGGAPTAPSSSTYIFEDTGRGFAVGCEIGYLISGVGYKVNRIRNEVSGVKLVKGMQGLEIGVRWGMEHLTNMLALMNAVGVDDFLSSQYTNVSGAGRYIVDGITSTDNGTFSVSALSNAGEVPYVVPTTETVNSGFIGLLGTKTITTSYATRMQGISLHMNYYPTESTVFRLQAAFSWHKKRVYGQDSTYQRSPHFYSARNFQCAFETVF